jgi:hypothetical protein
MKIGRVDLRPGTAGHKDQRLAVEQTCSASDRWRSPEFVFFRSEANALRDWHG